MDKANIDSIYPLSPMQQVLLVHDLQDDHNTSTVLQVTCSLFGTVDVAALEGAWQHTVQRHPLLRTAVYWDDLEKPLQVVFRRMKTDVEHHDLREGAASNPLARWQRLLNADKARGIDLSQAPATRLTSVRIGDRDYRLLWTCHHVLLDGWSAAIVLKDVFTAYASLVNGDTVQFDRPPRFRDYITWLEKQDMAKAQAYWRDALDGFRGAHPLGHGQSAPRGRAEAYSSETIALSEQESAGVQRFAHDHRVTPNTLIQGSVALALSALTAEPDVVLGVSVSGRPTDVPGVESIVGVFVNTLPVRVQVTRETEVIPWLCGMMTAQACADEFSYTPLTSIHEWSTVEPGRRLFESLIVFENYPWDGAATEVGPDLRVDDVSGGVTTNVPLTLVVVPGAVTTLQLIYERSRFGPDVIRPVLEYVLAVMRRIMTSSNQKIGDVLDGVVQPAFDSASGGLLVEIGEPAPRTAESVRPEGRNDIERGLVAIWRELLGCENIGVRDNFFDLGGHSILAVRLFAKIEESFGKPLPLSTLFRAPTIEAVARALQDNDRPADLESALLVPLQSAGSRPAVFAVGGVGGMVFRCMPLARNLGPDQPTYGLHAQGLDSRTDIQSRIEDMAATYIEEIRVVQQSGPYYLIGFSLGGAIALEMAQQLVAMGETVGMLGMLDAGPPNIPTSGGSWNVRALTNMIKNIPVWLYDSTRRSAPDLWQRTRARTAMYGQKVAGMLPRRNGDASKAPSVEDVVDTSEWPDRAREVAEVHFEAYRQYVPKPYPGRVSVFVARRQALGCVFDDDLGWSAVARDVTVYKVPGRHSTILAEPYVSALAEKVREALSLSSSAVGEQE
jgi:thioesterase domain-containing protein/acyl carrier protein